MLQDGRLCPCLCISNTSHSTWHIIDSQEMNEWMSKPLLLFLLRVNHCASLLLYPHYLIPHHSDWATITVWPFPRLRVRWPWKEAVAQPIKFKFFVPTFALKSKQNNAILEKAALGGNVFPLCASYASKHSLHRPLLFFSNLHSPSKQSSLKRAPFCIKTFGLDFQPSVELTTFWPWWVCIPDSLCHLTYKGREGKRGAREKASAWCLWHDHSGNSILCKIHISFL